MATVTIRWRSSGGRGEFEYVPSDTLDSRDIEVFLEAFGYSIPAEVRGVKAQGKPRLRKFDKNNRQKLHLPQLVMAIARLPEPARELHSDTVAFPLENKSFVFDSMDFDIIEDDGLNISLAPLRVSIRNTDYQIELQDRFSAIAEDWQLVDENKIENLELAQAISTHRAAVSSQINSGSIRTTADDVIRLQAELYGPTNAGSVATLREYESKPPVDFEEAISAKEGRLLTRIHTYKERDKSLSKKVKDEYRFKHENKLACEGCELDPEIMYGDQGERCIEAHHTIPIEELQPDSITLADDMAIVCANCHRIIHSRKPCLTLAELRKLLVEQELQNEK